MVSPAHLELATLVAAWHNRHPLARRITRADVLGTGVVAVPFRPPEGAFATLLARLRAPWYRLNRVLRRGGPPASTGSGDAMLRRAFDEDFVAPLSPRRVADFALRQGSATRPGPPEWPQRDVLPRASQSAAPPALRYLRTAAIEVEDARLRVLIGAGPRAQVLGPRLWSRSRIAGTAGSVAALVMGTAWWLYSPSADGDRLAAGAVAASAPGSSVAHGGAAASGVIALAVPAVPAAQGAASTSTPGAASASAPGATAATTPGIAAATSPPAVAASGAPVDAATALAAAAPASAASASDIRPRLSADLRAAARQESDAARAARAASAPADAPDPDGKVYAVATPATRTRAGSQLRLVLMDAPTNAEPGQPRVEVMQVGNNWHAVIWPFTNRAAAERARDVLASRGIPTEVIGF